MTDRWWKYFEYKHPCLNINIIRVILSRFYSFHLFIRNKISSNILQKLIIHEVRNWIEERWTLKGGRRRKAISNDQGGGGGERGYNNRICNSTFDDRKKKSRLIQSLSTVIQICSATPVAINSPPLVQRAIAIK